MRALGRFVVVSSVIVAAVFSSPASTPQLSAADRPYTTWSHYLGTTDSAQYSALKEIDKSNVKKLQVAWTFLAGDGTIRFDPVVVGNVMYVLPAPVHRRARRGDRP